ncbi:MAG: hypothetical protein RL294_794 [Actinomycetota bacterium]|jgi:hypothetical protein
MTDNFTALPSRRAQREARDAAESLSRESFGVPQTDVSARPADELPSRRSRRLPSSGLPHDYGYDDFGDEWITASSTVGQSYVPVTSLHVELFPTGEISGPIDNTGEIILTGPIVVAAASHNRLSPIAIDASPQVGLPGIPRRATEALSIIGRAAPLNQDLKISYSRPRVSAWFATFLGLLVAALIGLAFFTGLI